MEVWKIIFLSKLVICRFHVNRPGCIDGKIWPTALAVLIKIVLLKLRTVKKKCVAFQLPYFYVHFDGPYF